LASRTARDHYCSNVKIFSSRKLSGFGWENITYATPDRIKNNDNSKERVKKCKYIMPKISLSHYTHETIFKLKIKDRE